MESRRSNSSFGGSHRDAQSNRSLGVSQRSDGEGSGRGRRRMPKPASSNEQTAPATRHPHDVFTWGYGGQGALGNGAFRDELTPYLVTGLREFGGALLVNCGFDHTVAVTGDLRARAWGRAQEGQLGVEDFDAALESPRGGRCVLQPTVLGLCAGESRAAVQAVAAGGLHTLLLTMPRSSRDEPMAFAFGRGRDGQLGTGPEGLSNMSPVATALDLPTELPPVGVSAGGLHSAALSSHGHVFVWGDNGRGQLGLPPPTLSPEEQAAMGSLALAPPPAVSVPHLLPSAAFEGRAELEARVPITVSAADVGGETFVVRGRRHSPLQVSSISCGQYHTACCTTIGQGFAWGGNADGQLGLNDFVDRSSPSLVPLEHESRPIQVACGGRHTLILGECGEVWSSGCNLAGQLGHGEDFGTEPLKKFIEIDSLSDERVVLIACGGAHAAAVCADGTLYTWGKNHHGQLGLGHVSSEANPTKVLAFEESVAWVACGGSHTSALVRLGRLDEEEGEALSERSSEASGSFNAKARDDSFHRAFGYADAPSLQPPTTFRTSGRSTSRSPGPSRSLGPKSR